MQTRVQLYRADRKVTACALGEPSITLVRNDSAFGLLIATEAWEDSFSPRLHLEDVSYLCIDGTRWKYTDFATVSIFEKGGIWFAQDKDSGHYFPNPSSHPYQVIFLSETEFRPIQKARAKNLAFPVFTFAQRKFGRLPGFSFYSQMLDTPADYATRPEAISQADYVRSFA